MTPANKKTNVRMEYKDAMQSRKMAELLLKEGYPMGAISRLYYSVYRMVRALLFTVGEQPKSHRGAQHLFSLHFIKTGLLPKKFSKMLADLQEHRELSDYEAAFEMTDEDVSKDFEEADQMIKAIEEYLRKEGYLKNDE